MAKKKTPAIVAKVENFILVLRTVLEGLLNEIKSIEDNPVEEYGSRIAKMTLLVTTRKSAFETVGAKRSELLDFSDGIIAEAERLKAGAAKRAKTCRRNFKAAQKRIRKENALSQLRKDVRKLKKAVETNENGIAHQDKLLAGNDLKQDERELVETSRLERVEHLYGIREQLKAKQEELRPLQVESDRELAKLCQLVRGAETRLRNLPGEIAQVGSLIIEMRDLLTSTRSQMRKHLKRDENKLRHLKEKAAKRARRNTIEVPALPESANEEVVPVDESATEKTDELDKRIDQLAEEFDVDLSDDEVKEVIRELAEEQLQRSAAA